MMKDSWTQNFQLKPRILFAVVLPSINLYIRSTSTVTRL